MDNEIMEKEIGILLGINVAVDQNTVDPLAVIIFSTPLMPLVKDIRTPFSDKLCSEGKLGGQLAD